MLLHNSAAFLQQPSHHEHSSYEIINEMCINKHMIDAHAYAGLYKRQTNDVNHVLSNNALVPQSHLQSLVNRHVLHAAAMNNMLPRQLHGVMPQSQVQNMIEPPDVIRLP